MTDIKNLLTMWGQWSKGNHGLGYASAVLTPCGGGQGSSYEVDTQMLAVDTAMQWLKEHSEVDYRFLNLKYRFGYSYNRIATKMTRELPKYRDSKTVMCDKFAKSCVELAEETLLNYLQKNLDFDRTNR